MRKNLTFSLVISCLSLSGISVAQQELTGNEAGKRIPGATRILLDQKGNTPAFIVFDPAQATDLSAIDELKKQLFGNRPDDSWIGIRSEKDQLGMTHTRFQQQYKGINVDGNVFIFHSRNGKIVSANGHFTPQIDLSAVPSVTPAQAVGFAVAGIKDLPSNTAPEKSNAEIVVATIGGKTVLAYKTLVFSSHPLVNRCLYIDAKTGAVLQEINLLCAIDVNGTGHTQFSGNQTIVTDQLSANNYLLRESGRGNGIETIGNNSGVPYSDTDNDWDNVNGSMDEFAVDVHFGAEATYDFYFNHFGRNSFDNQGGVIRSFVNDESVGVNAYWSGGMDNTMHYGNGDADYFPVTSLDVAGHELTHGVTEYSAGLQYMGESGALNESFSDIFGNTIRFLSAPSNATWYIGDQILRPGGSGSSAFRNMSNPNEFLNPDTYGGMYFNSGDIVHYDSGIQNFWYYLLVEGGTGTNDIGDNYSVTGIGLDDAMDIAYRNLSYYLTPTSTFLDARYGAEQAAADLFGLCSDQHIQVIHAWYAVGVGPADATLEVTAGFTNPNSFACVAPLTAVFTGEGNYQSYSWNFGDGTTSTQQNPSHTYTSDGMYTVTLIVSNNNACQDPDTLVIQQAVVIDQIDPVAGFDLSGQSLLTNALINFYDASLYGPTSWSWDFGDGTTSNLQDPTHTYTATGVYTVQLTVQNCHGTDVYTSQIEIVDFILMCQTTSTDRPTGTIYDSGGENGDYQDNETCGLLIHPCHASSISLTFEEGQLEEFYDYLYVYDGNSNVSQMIGIFTGSDLPAMVQSSGGNMYIEFQSDYSYSLSGFKLSYTSELNSTPNSGSAGFYPMITDPDINQPVQFVDQSADNPVSWAWTFGDGGTSSLQYPIHTYTSAGIYTVTLTVTFCDGFTDEFTQVVTVGGVGLDELTQAGNALTIAPNPFHGQFVIGTGEALQQLELRILDLSGRVVHTQHEAVVSSQGIIVSPGLLSTGQYLLEAGYITENGIRGFERHKIQVQQ